ncbi:DUF6286 domain-containing protein [Gordonia terrae]|uniref:Alkaline shock response membrane anchor protein AmaP n=2 Tax=Gordonia terrae TaxID=2055 RepID=A0AAD0KC73_9ACTN|nr:DUF6286 domain-containing protein [Gordonia terrae]ANY24086.1 hypothetical protein BCM27_15945 [Gordonia terrae]AWO84829.1 hypothetical protein DLJ61_16110 [Gordonia terrae]GAB46089.1 hypothetical protein GOTRE_145_00990 [Gordonia terrae NBRC 100016]VTS56948.1 Uncharacterised protein [Gordonia terrae]
MTTHAEVAPDRATLDSERTGEPGHVFPPAALPGAAIAGAALGLAFIALGAVAVRDIAVNANWLDGRAWSVTAAEWIADLQWQNWMWPAAVGAILLGLILVWIAIKPRRRTHLELAGGDGMWTRPGDVARRCSAAVSDLPGVLDADTVVTRRKMTCTVGVRTQVADRALIETTADSVAADLQSPPRVVVRLRERGTRSVR